MAILYSDKARLEDEFLDAFVADVKAASDLWVRIFSRLYDIYESLGYDPRGFEFDCPSKIPRYQHAMRLQKGKGKPVRLRLFPMLRQAVKLVKDAGYTCPGERVVAQAYREYARFRWAGVTDRSMRGLGVSSFMAAGSIMRHSERRPRHQDVMEKVRMNGIKKAKEEYGVK